MTTHVNPVGIIKKDIYIIKNDINDKVYIGQSLNAEQRFKSHCKGDYDNSLIDKAIQKYGKQHFYFKILEAQIENYDEREQYWIKYYNSLKPNGYNIQEGGNKPPIFKGDNHPNIKISDEQVIQLKNDLRNTNMSLLELANKYNISKKQVLRINQGLSREQLGEKYPIRQNPNTNGKLTEEQVDEIIDILQHTYRFHGEIARQYGVQVHTISDIDLGISHKRNNIKYPIRNWKSSGTILFTYEQITDIINEILYTNHSLNSIATKYNVSFNAIKNICNGNAKKYRRENLHYPLRPF